MAVRVLFVDDEMNILQGLQRMLRSQRHEWEMEFAQGGAAAIEVLAREPYDVVVTDMRMPGMDGAELLRSVKERWPDAVRIVLSGNSQHENLLKCVDTAHQYLSKPCDPQALVQAVARSMRLRPLLQDKGLQRILAGLDTLPSLPGVYQKMVARISDPNASVREVGDVISEDLAMSAKILQIVNSAFFMLPRHVGSPGDAAVLLGLDVLRSLVLSTHVFRAASPQVAQALDLDALSRHSSMVAAFARRFAATCELDKRVRDEAFLAGLMHDVGKILLAQYDPKQLAKVQQRTADAAASHPEVERELIGTTHCHAGAYLLSVWGLPHSIVEAVAFHHAPAECVTEGITPLTCVHVAEEAFRVARTGAKVCSGHLDLGYLEAIGARVHMEEFLREVREQPDKVHA